MLQKPGSHSSAKLVCSRIKQVSPGFVNRCGHKNSRYKCNCLFAYVWAMLQEHTGKESCLHDITILNRCRRSHLPGWAENTCILMYGTDTHSVLGMKVTFTHLQQQRHKLHTHKTHKYSKLGQCCRLLMVIAIEQTKDIGSLANNIL